MRLHLLAFFSLLCWSTFLFSRTLASDNFELSVLDENSSYEEDSLYSSEEIRIHGRKSPRGLFRDEAIDCFGLGSKFSQALDWFLKNDANGTKALNVKFYAMSRDQQERVTLKHGEDFNLDNVDFDIRKRTVLIVHGFLATGDEKWIANMTKALLKWDDMNVFVVDWRQGSNTWNYYKAAVNTRTVADQIATFFGQLYASAKDSVKPSEFGPLHFIGHSLGSHICGVAAKEITKRKNKWTVQRITGLDPAQPCFKNSDNVLRLDASDAPFVDIIHTNARVLTRLGLGLPDPIGHIDFYPNGGKIQPGCIISESSLWKYLPLPLQKISETICSHGRSYLYFTDSVMSAVRKSCKFWANQWDLRRNQVDKILNAHCDQDSCIEMGINSEKYSLKGTFFVLTGKVLPFCHVDESDKEEVKEILEKIKRKLPVEDNESSKNFTSVVYSRD